MPRVLLTLEVEVEQIMKGGFDHYMQVRAGRLHGAEFLCMCTVVLQDAVSHHGCFSMSRFTCSN